MNEEDYEDDELVVVKLPRSDVRALRKVIERENVYTWFGTRIKSWWIWVIASGILTFITLYKDIVGIFK